MNYELAKKLKDAGFPQEMVGGDYCFYGSKVYIHTGGGHLEVPSNRKEGLYMGMGSTCCIAGNEEKYLFNIYDDLVVKIPTLSELIKACGGKLTLTDVGPNWRAYKHGLPESDCDGQTPEVAVANLWLELNKKDEFKKEKTR